MTFKDPTEADRACVANAARSLAHTFYQNPTATVSVMQEMLTHQLAWYLRNGRRLAFQRRAHLRGVLAYEPAIRRSRVLWWIRRLMTGEAA